MAGMAYRKRAQAGFFMTLTFAFAILAVVMVYTKPF